MFFVEKVYGEEGQLAEFMNLQKLQYKLINYLYFKKKTNTLSSVKKTTLVQKNYLISNFNYQTHFY